MFNWYIFLVEWVNEISEKSSIDWIRNSYFWQTVGVVISIITCSARVPNQENFKHTSSTRCLVVVKKTSYRGSGNEEWKPNSCCQTSTNLRSGSIFVLLSFCIPVGKAKRKENLVQTFSETSSTYFFDWLSFAESANQNYFRYMLF